MHTSDSLSERRAYATSRIDAHAELIENEKPTGRLLAIQLKSGTRATLLKATEDAFVFRIDAEHIKSLAQSFVAGFDLSVRREIKAHVYWEHVNSTTAISTGKGYKINVPKSRKLVSDATAELMRHTDANRASRPIHTNANPFLLIRYTLRSTIETKVTAQPSATKSKQFSTTLCSRAEITGSMWFGMLTQ